MKRDLRISAGGAGLTLADLQQLVADAAALGLSPDSWIHVRLAGNNMKVGAVEELTVKEP